MNKLRSIIRPLVCILLGTYLLLLFVLNFSPTKRMMTEAAASLLGGILKTEVQIGSLEIGLFNRFILKDVTVKDTAGKTIIHSDLLTAKIELRSLVKERLALRTISVLDAEFNLYQKDEQSAPNFQFLLDAFSSEKEAKPVNLQINSLILRRVNFRYDRLDLPETPGKWNLGRIAVNDLDANVSLKYLTPDSLSLRLRRLSFKEHSGFVLKKLNFKLRANRTTARLNDFECSLPASNISEKALTAHYDARKNWKNLWPSLSLSGRLSDTSVSLVDFAPFLRLPSPELARISVNLHTNYRFKPNEISLSDIRIKERQGDFSLAGNVILGKQSGKVTDISAHLQELTTRPEFPLTLLDCLTPQKDTTLIRAIRRLGSLKASGKGRYDFISRKGNASIQTLTDAGRITAEAGINGNNVSSNLYLTDIRPAYLLANPNLPSSVTLHADTRLRFQENKRLSDVSGKATISRLSLLGRDYTDILVNGHYQNGKIRTEIVSRNAPADLRLSLHALLQDSTAKELKMTANVIRFVPSAFGLNSSFKEAAFSGQLETDLTFNRKKELRGQISLNSFEMTNGPRGNATIDRLDLHLSDAPSGGRLTVKSDFANLDLEGVLSPVSLRQAGEAIVRRALPGLLKESGKQTTDNGKWRLNAELLPSNVYHTLFGVNLSLGSPLVLQGTLDGGTERTVITASVDSLSVYGQRLGRTTLFLEGRDSLYHVLAKSQKKIKDNPFNLAADFTTQQGRLQSRITWYADTHRNYQGEFSFNTRFLPRKTGTPSFNIHILPTSFILADTLWNIASGELSLLDKTLTFNHIHVGNAHQSLSVQGRFSPDRNDSIIANLKAIDIDYILSLVDFNAVEFGGRATGRAVMIKKGNYPVLQARIHVPDFTFNQGAMGAADISGGWSSEDNRILLNADMKLPETKRIARTRVKGFVDLREKGLRLDIRADHTNLRFLRRYMAGIFSDFEGDATGDISIYGPFKALDFQGEAKANAEARIDAIGVKYRVLDGTVKLLPGTFAFSDFKVEDENGGSGTANGALRHTHLANLNYDFNVRANRLLCYDCPATPDLPFSSHTVGTGLVKLNGEPGRMTADISLRPETGTTLSYMLGTAGTFSADEKTFRFHTAQEENAETKATHEPETKAEETTTDIKLHFLIDMNPAAEVKIVTDPRAGDAITAYGDGPIRAVFHNKGNFEMYGTYRLQRGNYKLSLQDIIRKEFTLKEGSSLTFAGNPLQADLDLRAAYTVNGVSLSDLNYAAEFAQKTARVDCLLNIGGKAASPQVNFDLDLHNISSDEKQMVRQLIATEEGMNRQAIYLLGVGRFYTAGAQNGLSQSTSRDQSSAAMKSFLSTTLTGQLNNAIASAIGNRSNWSFGTNFSPGAVGWSDIEIDGLFQGRLFNDRLLINGNFGYRDRPTYTSNFVGDFDIRYLLTPRGTVSLKAYSETTDRYFTKSALTTQGVGITLQRDFTGLRDLFRRNTGRKAEKAESKESK